jgi:hypothetical protein
MYENRCGLPRQARDDPNEIERCAPCSEEERVGDCKNVIVHTLRVHHLDHLGKRHSRFEFSLCLSRACLGKMIIFIYKWLKKWRFCTIPIKPVAAGLRRSKMFQEINIEQIAPAGYTKKFWCAPDQRSGVELYPCEVDCDVVTEVVANLVNWL